MHKSYSTQIWISTVKQKAKLETKVEVLNLKIISTLII